MQQKVIKKILTMMLLSVAILGFSQISLSTPLQGPLFMAESTNKPLKRGEGVDMIVSTLKLVEKEKEFLKYCYKSLEECLFPFSARSDYDKISIKPLILYPDVFPAYKYYKSINTASLLNLVSGYFHEPSSPFKPEEPLTRIQALKIVLGAADILGWKDAFELSEPEKWPRLPFTDLNEWWYGRYVKAAYEAGLIEKSDHFRPDDPITDSELIEILLKTFDFQHHASQNKS